MTRLAVVLTIGLFAAPVGAEEGEDGLSAFFACVDAVEWSPPTYDGYAKPSPAQRCFDALEASVPGWCPLMDNQIRTRQGDALFQAAQRLTGGQKERSVELGDVEYTLFPDPTFGRTTGFESCPGVEETNVADGVSKEAICHQRAGWAALSSQLFLSGHRGAAE